jgi:hypothetical protein
MIARSNWRSQRWVSSDAANLMIIDRSGGNVIWYPHPPADLPDPPLHRGEGGYGGAGSPPVHRGRGGYGGAGSPPMHRGPDDDPEFLRQLAQRIHGSSTDPD